MSKPLNVTMRGLRRLQAILKRRSKEAKPNPDICIVLPVGFGFRPGDPFAAEIVNGKLVVTNKRKLTARQKRELSGGGVYHSQVNNADWSSRLLPCPFCGSRAYLWPDVPELQQSGYRNFEVRCTGCKAQTSQIDFQSAEEAVAAWNWRVQPPALGKRKPRK